MYIETVMMASCLMSLKFALSIVTLHFGLKIMVTHIYIVLHNSVEFLTLSL